MRLNTEWVSEHPRAISFAGRQTLRPRLAGERGTEGHRRGVGAALARVRKWPQHPQQPEELEYRELWLLPPQQPQPLLPCRRRLLGKQQQPTELEPPQPQSPQQPESPPEPQQPLPQHPELQEEVSGAGAGQGVGPCEGPLGEPLALC